MRTPPPALWPLGVVALLSCPLGLRAEVDENSPAAPPPAATAPATRSLTEPSEGRATSPVLERAGASAPTSSAASPAPSTNAPLERSRAMSPTTAARLAEKMPRFVPPQAAPPTAASAGPDEPPVDLRETDKPRNTIVRLPKFMVMEDKPPTFKEREILTPKGHLSLAYKRYAGLKIGNLGGLNDALALAMLEEDRILERQAEMSNLVGLLPTSKPAKAK